LKELEVLKQKIKEKKEKRITEIEKGMEELELLYAEMQAELDSLKSSFSLFFGFSFFRKY